MVVVSEHASVSCVETDCNLMVQLHHYRVTMSSNTELLTRNTARFYTFTGHVTAVSCKTRSVHSADLWKKTTWIYGNVLCLTLVHHSISGVELLCRCCGLRYDQTLLSMSVFSDKGQNVAGNYKL